MKKLIFASALLFAGFSGHSQVLISLIFGKSLNSGKVEFGLDGGLTVSGIQGLEGARNLNGFNLGFYFDIKLKNPSWMFNTGVLVRSPMGARGLPVYSLDNPALDSIFQGGSVQRNLRYFQVPLMLKYRFKSNIYVKAGTQLGLLNKASDVFNQTVISNNDLTYTVRNRSNYHPIDAGLVIGAGYRLMSGNGINIGVQYYIGLVDITIDDSTPGQFNKALYVTAGIPIGAGGKQKKAAEKTAAQ